MLRQGERLQLSNPNGRSAMQFVAGKDQEETGYYVEFLPHCAAVGRPCAIEQGCSKEVL
jgi:hypothetical protein